MSETRYPKITVIHQERGDTKVFIGEDEFKFNGWVEKAEPGYLGSEVTLVVMASSVEFKHID